MVNLPEEFFTDPTLAAADRELEARARLQPRRTYLGMSAIGRSCERQLWYDYHQPLPPDFDALTLKRFEDGHRSEDLMAMRLRMAPDVQLWTVDPDTGQQFACTDFDDKFKGHLDGVILGLHQAPQTPHVWEGKCVNEKKFKSLQTLKTMRGEKNTLIEWDPVYYAQAQCYMGYYDLHRHYLTVCTPGGRDWDSVRTEFNKEAFEKIKDKARRILNAKAPLAKLRNDPNFFECKWCSYQKVCHGIDSEKDG
jgi:hypothetical protein